MKKTWRRVRIILLAVVQISLIPSWAIAETIFLGPDKHPLWSSRNLAAPFSSLFRGPRYWYGERKLEIETVPPGAALDLFYIRSNFQKRYEQADAPVTVLLPRRVEGTNRDSVTIRAFMDGYRQVELSVRLDSREENILIELPALDNMLRAVSYTYFAGRASINFLTEEKLSARIQKTPEGLTVVLGDTGKSETVSGVLDRIRGGQLLGMNAQQLGEDLLVRVNLSASKEKRDIRSRESYDRARDLYRYSLDLIPPDGGAKGIEDYKRALSQIQRQDVTGCAAVFDEMLRKSFDRAALSRAITPQGVFTDSYLREAMKRLGEISVGGKVKLLNGSSYNTKVEIELMAAMSEADQVKGYLALLRQVMRRMESAEGREAVLKGIIAPEVDTADFSEWIKKAEAHERTCHR